MFLQQIVYGDNEAANKLTVQWSTVTSNQDENIGIDVDESGIHDKEDMVCLNFTLIKFHL